MKALDVVITVLVLTCFAFLPLSAQAEEGLVDLDVTMEVLDDGTGLADNIADMAGRRGRARGQTHGRLVAVVVIRSYIQCQTGSHFDLCCS